MDESFLKKVVSLMLRAFEGSQKKYIDLRTKIDVDILDWITLRT